jgi:hypothetical protein
VLAPPRAGFHLRALRNLCTFASSGHFCAEHSQRTWRGPLFASASATWHASRSPGSHAAAKAPLLLVFHSTPPPPPPDHHTYTPAAPDLDCRTITRCSPHHFLARAHILPRGDGSARIFNPGDAVFDRLPLRPQDHFFLAHVGHFQSSSGTFSSGGERQ